MPRHCRTSSDISRQSPYVPLRAEGRMPIVIEVCWPRPEVPSKTTIDMTTGSLGLTDHEEDLIVIFLQTLTDGFTTPYANADTFTGRCMTGGSAKTQGNETLIPTPPLPP